MQIIITNDQGAPEVRCDLADWIVNNRESFEPAEIERIIAAMGRGEEYRAGAGAGAMFTLRRAAPTVEDVLASPATSYWLKGAIEACLKRDPIDAWSDADLLTKLLHARMNKTLGRD